MINLEATKTKAITYLLRAQLYQDDIDRLDRLGYFKAPASKGHHLACPGGLMLHSINVADCMFRVRPAFRHLRDENIYRIAMLHDLVKCLCYELCEGGAYRYVQPPFPGHGVASVLICLTEGISLMPEEAAAITWHMGAFGLTDREMKEYQAAVRRFPTAIILTHAADHLASVLEEERSAE